MQEYLSAVFHAALSSGRIPESAELAPVVHRQLSLDALAKQESWLACGHMLELDLEQLEAVVSTPPNHWHVTISAAHIRVEPQT